MKRAVIFFREGLRDRIHSFGDGLRAAGYAVVPALPFFPTPEDVLIIWNRYGESDAMAKRFEEKKARVIVVENGHLGKEWRETSGGWYAMALGHHAGAGAWPNGGPQRWDRWGVPLAPWRMDGEGVLVLAQRGIGEPGIASPRGWAEGVAHSLPQSRIREHPEKRGMGVAPPPLEEDLRGVRAVVTWHSAAASKALMMGVPVFYDCPTWIGRSAGKPLSALRRGEEPLRDDEARLNMFRNMAWAMWELEEIQRGDPFKHLLQ